MLNLIGSEFDIGNMVHSVLADCEHRRRAMPDEDFASALQENAQKKLAASREAFEAAGGDPSHWQTVEEEVLHTALPQYVRIAERQNHLERTHYEVWRNGDLAARLTFALGGLVIGGIIVAVPFIPIFVDAFAFFLALCGWFYPELKKLFYDIRYTRELNAILEEASEFNTQRSLDLMLAYHRK